MPLPDYTEAEANKEGVDHRAPSPPYPHSTVIRSVKWDAEPVRLGDGRTVGDNWPITWGDDDINYTTFGDGSGFGGRQPGLTIGFARIHGDPPNHRAEDVETNIDAPKGSGPTGIKSSGLIMVDGVLYLFVRNYIVDGSWYHSRLAWSEDRGRTWTWADWHFSGTFGCPDFIQFGKHYAEARDEYVYIVSQNNDNAYFYNPDLVLARVPKDRIRDRKSYEFYSGNSGDVRPAWSSDIEKRKPIFTDRRGVQRVGLTYNPGMKRYILASSHWTGAGTHTPALGVFDAPEPWGPWTTLYYSDDWSGEWGTFHHKFPSKWISGDGSVMWLLYSGLGGGNYSFCLRRVTLDIV